MSVDVAALVRSFSMLISAAVTNDVDQRDRAAVEALVVEAACVQALAEAVRLAAVSRLEQLATDNPSMDPTETIARRGNTGGREAQRTARRARAVQQIPQLSDLLTGGRVSGDHLDVVAQALARLEPDERARLAGEGAWIATIAANSTPEALAKALRRRVRQLSTDDGIARFERQRRATTLRGWNDPDTGMYRLVGEFDPESGTRLARRLARLVESLFHDGTLPDSCPDDDRKQGHLVALALLDLVARSSAATGTPTNPRSGTPRTEFLVVIDQQTLFHRPHPASRVEVDGGFDLPIQTLRRLACIADIIPVVLGGDGVARDVGRASRIATPTQRRAMRAMYSTCAVPGCCVPFDQTDLHHVTYWRNGGRSDLDNFIPLCSKHHYMAHEGGWKLHLHPTTHHLTITLPDGTTRANPPPFAAVA